MKPLQTIEERVPLGPGVLAGGELPRRRIPNRWRYLCNNSNPLLCILVETAGIGPADYT